MATLLEQNPHLSTRTLRCEAAEGHVVLRGTVRSYYQKQMAQEMLKTVDGVDTIENQLEVCWQVDSRVASFATASRSMADTFEFGQSSAFASLGHEAIAEGCQFFLPDC